MKFSPDVAGCLTFQCTAPGGASKMSDRLEASGVVIASPRTHAVDPARGSGPSGRLDVSWKTSGVDERDDKVARGQMGRPLAGSGYVPLGPLDSLHLKVPCGAVHNYV